MLGVKQESLLDVDKEEKMANLTEIIKGAMSLDVRDRAVLAEKLLASLDELSEGEADPPYGQRNRNDD